MRAGTGECCATRAGITPLGPHRLRRTFATWSLRSGCDIETLRRLMEHSSLTILRGYLALVEADLKNAHSEHSPIRIVEADAKKRRNGSHASQDEHLKSARNNHPSGKRRKTKKPPYSW
ncbi:MAG: tyrosine-type recombinase/integrase [Armatimonadota bacterium]